MFSLFKKRSLGIFAENDGGWIAGVLYLKTVLNALSMLPKKERPRLNLIMPRKVDTQHYLSFGKLFDSTRYFDFRRGINRKATWRVVRRTFKVHRQLACSFERLVEKKADVLFPLQYSLGTEFPVPWIGWIPDFQHRRCPHYFSAAELTARDDRFQKLIDDANHIVVSSHDAKQDLFRWYNARPQQVSVYQFCTYADPVWFDSDPIEVARSFDLPEKFIMFPSQFWIHKNHLNLFRAIHLLKQSGISNMALVLTGNDHDYRHPEYAASLKQFIVENDLESNVFHVGLLPRDQQIQLMRRAAAIVQPSHFEGWSMLVEDCRALGKKVYLSDIPVHREQSPPTGVFFDPNVPQEIADQIGNDWEGLSPGPEPLLEVAARAANLQSVRASGRVFNSILESTIRNGQTRKRI